MSEATRSGSSLPNELVDSAMKQSVRDRGELAALLLESLDETSEGSEDANDEWSTEFTKRIEDIESGKVQLVDGQASLKRLRDELRERHGI